MACVLAFLSISSGTALAATQRSSQCGVLSYGAKGACVATLQRELDSYHIIPRLRVDGSFGRMTRWAVINFQRHRGLTADGVVGKYTWLALNPPAPDKGSTSGAKSSNFMVRAMEAMMHVIVQTTTIITSIIAMTLLLALVIVFRLSKNHGFKDIEFRHGKTRFRVRYYPEQPMRSAGESGVGRQPMTRPLVADDWSRLKGSMDSWSQPSSYDTQREQSSNN